MTILAFRTILCVTTVALAMACNSSTKDSCRTDNDCLSRRVCISGTCQPERSDAASGSDVADTQDDRALDEAKRVSDTADSRNEPDLASIPDLPSLLDADIANWQADVGQQAPDLRPVGPAEHRLDVFALDRNGRVCMRRWNEGYTPTLDLPMSCLAGPPLTSLTAVAWGGGLESVMGVDEAGHLSYATWDRTKWSPFTDLGGLFQGQPAAVAWGGNRLTVFARTIRGEILTRSWDGASWNTEPFLSPWQDFGGSASGALCAIATNNGVLNVAARSSNGGIVFRSLDGATGSPTGTWQDLGGVFQFGPAMFAWGGNRITVLAIASGGQLASNTWQDTTWGGWVERGAPGKVAFASAPAVVVRPGDAVSIFALAADRSVLTTWTDGTNWGTWTSLGGNLATPPAATLWHGSWMALMGITPTGTIQYKWWNAANGQWGPGPTNLEWTTDLGRDMLSSPAMAGWDSE